MLYITRCLVCDQYRTVELQLTCEYWTLISAWDCELATILRRPISKSTVNDAVGCCRDPIHSNAEHSPYYPSNMFGYFRQVLYISLLVTNAIAILNDRFLHRGKLGSDLGRTQLEVSHPGVSSIRRLSRPQSRSSSALAYADDISVGWSTRSAQSTNAGFGQAPNSYDTSFGNEISIKTKLVNLIEATRTLMRSKFKR